MTSPHKHTGRSPHLPSPTQQPANLLILLESLQKSSCYSSDWMAPVLCMFILPLTTSLHLADWEPSEWALPLLCSSPIVGSWTITLIYNHIPKPLPAGACSIKDDGSPVLGFLSVAAEPPRPLWWARCITQPSVPLGPRPLFLLLRDCTASLGSPDPRASNSEAHKGECLW